MWQPARHPCLNTAAGMTLHANGWAQRGAKVGTAPVLQCGRMGDCACIWLRGVQRSARHLCLSAAASIAAISASFSSASRVALARPSRASCAVQCPSHSLWGVFIGVSCPLVCCSLGLHIVQITVPSGPCSLAHVSANCSRAILTVQLQHRATGPGRCRGYTAQEGSAEGEDGQVGRRCCPHAAIHSHTLCTC